MRSQATGRRRETAWLRGNASELRLPNAPHIISCSQPTEGKPRKGYIALLCDIDASFESSKERKHAAFFVCGSIFYYVARTRLNLCNGLQGLVGKAVPNRGQGAIVSTRRIFFPPLLLSFHLPHDLVFGHNMPPPCTEYLVKRASSWGNHLVNSGEPTQPRSAYENPEDSTNPTISKTIIEEPTAARGQKLNKSLFEA